MSTYTRTPADLERARTGLAEYVAERETKYVTIDRDFIADTYTLASVRADLESAKYADADTAIRQALARFEALDAFRTET